MRSRSPGAHRRSPRMRQRSPEGMRQRSPGGMRQRSPGGMRQRSPGGGGGMRQRSPGRMRSRSPGGMRQRSPGRMRSRSPGGMRQRSPGRWPRERSPMDQGRGYPPMDRHDPRGGNLFNQANLNIFGFAASHNAHKKMSLNKILQKTQILFLSGTLDNRDRHGPRHPQDNFGRDGGGGHHFQVDPRRMPRSRSPSMERRMPMRR